MKAAVRRKNRILAAVILLLVVAFSLAMLAACSKQTIESFSVIEDSVPTVAFTNDFDISVIRLLVVHSVGEEEGEEPVTSEISAAISMLNTADRAKLKTVGTHTITLNYLKKTAQFEIYMVAPDTDVCTVTFLNSDGSVFTTRPVVKGEALTRLPSSPPAPDGKVFLGWYIGDAKQSFTSVDDNISVTAKFSVSAQVYTVKFVDHKGQELQSGEYNFGDKVVPPAFELPVELASFRWSVDVSTFTVTSNYTIRVEGTPRTFKVTYRFKYNNNNTNEFALNTNETVGYGGAPAKVNDALSELNSRQLNFLEWVYKPTQIFAETEILALVEARSYTISYTGVTPPIPPATALVGTQIALPTTANPPTGYEFNGVWKDVSKGTVFSLGYLTVDGDRTLEPVYSPKPTVVEIRINFEGKTQGSDPLILTQRIDGGTGTGGAYFGQVVNVAFIETYGLNVIKNNPSYAAYGLASFKIESVKYNGEEVLSFTLGTLSPYVFNVTAVDATLPSSALDIVRANASDGFWTVRGFKSGKATAALMNIPDTYTFDGVTLPIARIADNAFSNTTINISYLSKNITRIGANAFKGATVNTNLTFESLTEIGATAFENAKTTGGGEIKITFASTCTLVSIPTGTFRGTRGITEVVLCATIVTIEASAFENSGLVKINLTNVKTIGASAFSSSAALTDIGTTPAVENVGANAFSSTKVTSIDMPKLATVANQAFSNMTALTSVSIASSVTPKEAAVDFNIISGSFNVATLTFGEGVKTIALTSMASGNYKLQTLNLTSTVTTLSTSSLSSTFKQLVAINVTGNGAYASDSGVLYSVDANAASLIVYPAGKPVNYAVPKTVASKNVTTLATAAFSNCATGEFTAVVLEFASQITGLQAVFTANASIFFYVPQAMLDTVTGANVKLISTNGTLYDTGSKLVYTVANNKVTIVSAPKYADAITVPASIDGKTVTAIGTDAFKDFTSLTTLTINATLESLSVTALAGCTSLENISIAAFAVTAAISFNHFKDTKLYATSELLCLGGRLISYKDTASLTVITAEMLKGVTEIASGVFAGAVNLKEIQMSDDVRRIASGAFTNCNNLTVVGLNKVTFIGENAFKGSGIRTLYSNALVDMQTSAFEGCASLTSVEIMTAVNGGYLPVNAFKNCSSLSSVKIPLVIGLLYDGTGSNAFYGCTTLSDISFVRSFAKIPAYAFYGSAVSGVDFSNTSVLEIGAYAFNGCSKLLSVTIPAAVMVNNVLVPFVIGTEAFGNCALLKTVSFVGTGGLLQSVTPIDTVTSRLFPENVTIFVNASILNTVKNGALKNYSDINGVYPTVTFALMPSFGIGGAGLNMNAITGSVYLDGAPEAPTANGYVFAGWYVKPNISQEIYIAAAFPMALLSNVTLYAKYYSEAKGSLVDTDLKDARSEGLDLDGWVIAAYKNSAESDAYIPSVYAKSGQNARPIVALYAGAFKDCLILTKLVLPEGIKIILDGGYEYVGANVSRLDGANANAGFNTALKELSLPASLVEIRNNALNHAGLNLIFAAGSNLITASKANFDLTKWYADARQAAEGGANGRFIVAGRLAIEYVGSDEDVRIPGGVIKLNDDLFRGNTTIKTAALPSSLLYIGDNCFKDAKNLAAIKYENDDPSKVKLLSLGVDAFKDTYWFDNTDTVTVGTVFIKYRGFSDRTQVIVPAYIETISEYAFYNSDRLTTVVFEAGSKLREIGDSAFNACTRLSAITLPSSLVKMGVNVFSDCTALITANLSNVAIEILPTRTFANCSSLVTLTLNASVKEFGLSAVDGCSKLENITADGFCRVDGAFAATGLSTTRWYAVPTEAGAHSLILGKVFVRFTYIGSGTVSAEIPTGIELILAEAFSGAAALKEVAIASSVKEIGSNAFFACVSLTTVTFDAGSLLTVIGHHAFASCSVLSSIVLPTGLLTIGSYAFNRTALVEIDIPNTVISIGTFAFGEISTLETVKLSSEVLSLSEYAFADSLNLYRVEWLVSVENLIEVTKAGTDNNGSQAEYIEKVFRKEDSGNRVEVRIYTSYDTYSAVYSPSGEGALAGIGAWKAVGGYITMHDLSDVPWVTFAGEGYDIPGFQAEVITQSVYDEKIGTPVRAGFTFMAWYTDALKTQKFIIPAGGFKVHSGVTLTPDWFPNNIDAVSTARDNWGLTVEEINGTYRITAVANTVTTLYIPDTINNMPVTQIALTSPVPSVTKVVFTEIGNFNGLSSNCLMAFPNLTAVEIASKHPLQFKVEDGGLYSVDGKVLFSYFGNVNNFSVPDGVERIAENAFINYTRTTVNIPKSVTAIGQTAFANSVSVINFAQGIVLTDADKASFNNTAWYKSSLAQTSYTLGGSSSALGTFYSAGNILLQYHSITATANLVIPTALKTFDITVIASNIYGGENKLSFDRVTLPNNLVRINLNAFNNIDIVSDVVYTGSTLNEIADDVFKGTQFYEGRSNNWLVLGTVLIRYLSTASFIDLTAYNDTKNITSISKGAFANSKMSSVVLPNTLKYIGEEAFYNCENLASINIPQSVTFIGKNAFANCQKLEAATFTQGLYTSEVPKLVIGDKAFYNCVKLVTISVPYNAVSIGSEAFLNCTALTSATFDYNYLVDTSVVTVKSLLTSLGSGAFYNCSKLTTIKIPDGVTAIEAETFYNARALETVVFDIDDSRCTSIGTSAFENCVKLGGKVNLNAPTLLTVRMPNSLLYVRTRAFANCVEMLGIEFNFNLKLLEAKVFKGCLRLTKVSVFKGTPPTIDNNTDNGTFDRTSEISNDKPYFALRIYVNESTDGSVKALYKNAWSVYASNIYARNELPMTRYTYSGTTKVSVWISGDILVRPEYLWNQPPNDVPASMPNTFERTDRFTYLGIYKLASELNGGVPLWDTNGDGIVDKKDALVVSATSDDIGFSNKTGRNISALSYLIQQEGNTSVQLMILDFDYITFTASRS